MKEGRIVKKQPLQPIVEGKKSLLNFSRKQLCIPYGLFLVFFVMFPLLLIVYYAFTNGTGEFTIDNFTAFFNDTTKISTLIISIFVSLLVTFLCLLIAYPVAYVLSRMNGKTAFVLLLLFILPTWLNFVLRAMAMKEVLSLIGVPLGNGASIIGLVYDFLPFMILPIYTTIIPCARRWKKWKVPATQLCPS